MNIRQWRGNGCCEKPSFPYIVPVSHALSAYIHVAWDRQPGPVARTAQAASDGRNLVRWHRPSTGIFPGLWPPREPKFPSPKGC